MKRIPRVFPALAVAAAILLPARVSAAVFANPSAIAMPPNPSGPALLYPSPITVSGLTGGLAGVTVTLSNVTHAFVGDMDILLVAPTGQKFILVSDAGGGFSNFNVSVTFSDAAASLIPSAGGWAAGGVTTWKPANYGGTVDAFAAPAPSAPYETPATNGVATLTSTFGGINPNGAWNLYLVDDSSSDGGAINGGWSISIETSNVVAKIDYVRKVSATNFNIVGTNRPGVNVVMEVSTNLVNWSYHMDLLAGAPDGGTWSINDSNNTPPLRFYRTQANPQLPPKLMSWWHADDTYRDGFRTNHAVVANASTAPTFVSGVRGNAWFFNGTNSGLQIQTNAGGAVAYPWTAAFWVKRHDATNGSATLFADTNSALVLEQTGTARRVSISAIAVTNHNFNYTAPTNVWTHLAFVCNSNNSVITTTLYTNGVAADTNGAALSFPLRWIGFRSGADRAHAALDEITLFDRALTPAEVQQVYNVTRAP
jgi:subtilisin-like proprotein convertase family protein